ncbi:MAG: hypothetical protein IE916_00600 [Epsilonproteobacteria bacterium]|nr:hypothetical protein [Campylobacterota bacterium]
MDLKTEERRGATKMGYKKSLGLFLVTALAFGANGYNYDQKGAAATSLPLPDNKDKNKDNSNLIRNRFEMDLDKDVAREVTQKRDEFQRTMHRTEGLEMLMTPLEKPFKSIDSLEVTSEFTTTVFFPDRYKITGALPSEELDRLEHSANILTIKPKRNFLEGNIFVALTDGQKNTGMTINLYRHLPNRPNPDAYSSPLAEGNQYISTMIIYIDKPNVPYEEILDAYFTLAECDPSLIFTEDGVFDVLIYQNVPFYIIRDDKFGFISLNDINYRIETKYEGFGGKRFDGICSKPDSKEDMYEISKHEKSDRRTSDDEIYEHDEYYEDIK